VVTTPNGAFAGFNLHDDVGTINSTDPNVRVMSGEATHMMPTMEDASGNVTWTVTWTAPLAPGNATLTLWGNSVNFDHTSTNDNAPPATPQTQPYTPAPPMSATASTPTASVESTKACRCRRAASARACARAPPAPRRAARRALRAPRSATASTTTATARPTKA